MSEQVTVVEIIERLEALGNQKAYDLITRIHANGIAPPDGWVSVASVIAALPKLNAPVSEDTFEYRERYKRFVKDMAWVRERIAMLSAVKEKE